MRRKPASRRYRPLQIKTASNPHAIPITANTGRVVEPRVVVRWHVEQWPGTEQCRVHRAGNARRDDEWHERAVRELEEQQLDREHDRRERCSERRRHACGRTAREQDLAFRRRHSDHLSDQGAERAASDDDRSFGAERSAGADGDRGRQRLCDGGPRCDAALAREDRLHGFGNSVTADHRRPTREQRHNERTGCGFDEEDWPRMKVLERRQCPAPAVEQHHVRDQPDQVEQGPTPPLRR